jgi:hypothetical protein
VTGPPGSGPLQDSKVLTLTTRRESNNRPTTSRSHTLNAATPLVRLEIDGHHSLELRNTHQVHGIDTAASTADAKSGRVSVNRSRPRRHLSALIVAVALIACVPGPPAMADPNSSFDLQAHRGGRGETTEESLRAFGKALELGVDTLEMDIVLSRDGQPMVWHDPVIQADKCADTASVFPGDPQFPFVG